MGVFITRSSIASVGVGLQDYYGLDPDRFIAGDATGSDNGLTENAPWTWAQYLANGSASMTIGALPGVFTGSNTADRYATSFLPLAGASGNPTIIVCKRAAAYNTVDRTRWSNGVTSGDAGCPVIGSDSVNYIRWIGAYVDENLSRRFPDTGPAVFRACTGGEIHASRIDGLTIDVVDNHNCVRLDDSTDCVVKNNYLTGIRKTSGDNHNFAAIMTYGSRGSLIEHNELPDNACAIFIKGSTQGGTRHNSGIIRYNKIYDTAFGVHFLEVHTGEELVVTHNLIYDYEFQGLVWDNSVSGATLRNVKVRNNTVARPLSTVERAVWIENIGVNTGHELTDNILVAPDTAGARCVDGFDYSGSAFTISGNHHYQSGGTRRWSWDGANQTTIANWQTASSATSETEGDPLFVNSAGGDFRLQGGSPAAGKGCFEVGTEVMGLES